MNTLDPWRQGDNFSTLRHQDLVDRANEDALSSADINTEVLASPSGTSLFPRGTQTILDIRRGIIVNKGPATSMYSGGQPDFTGPMYWVQFAMIKGDVITNPALLLPDPPGQDASSNYLEPYPVPVTNLAESTMGGSSAAGTHSLPTGGTMGVIIFHVLDVAQDTSGTQNDRWVMVAAPPGAVVVKLTSISSYTGRYGGATVTGVSTDAGTGDLSMPDGLGVGSTDSVEVLNVDEDTGSTGAATNTHRLKLNTFAIGIQIGQTTESTPRPLVFIHGGVGEPSTGLITMGAGSLGSLTADTTAWSRNTDGKPLDLWFISRSPVLDTTNSIVYAFLRKLTLDARGIPMAVSAETKINADTGTVCP